MSDTYDYESLKQSYKAFTAPAAKFTIGGTDILQIKSVHIRSLEAVLSLKSAGSVKLVVSDCYDYKNGAFAKEVKSLMVLGKEIELSLGYASSFQKVFKGFLASTNMIFDAEEGIFLEFTAMDVRWLMMTDNFHIREHKITNYSDAVKDILKRYQKLCTAVVDETSENFEEGLIFQRASDYDFITRDLIESGKTNREFFVVADKAYFRAPKSTDSVMITIGIGKGLIQFARKAQYENQTIHVLGFDPSAHAMAEGNAVSKASDKQMDVLGSSGERMITDISCETSAQAKNRAKALADQFLAKRQKAEGRCIGLPELVPGRFIQLERVDEQMNHKYYITQVTHTYDEDGFYTDFMIEGWE